MPVERGGPQYLKREVLPIMVATFEKSLACIDPVEYAMRRLSAALEEHSSCIRKNKLPASLWRAPFLVDLIDRMTPIKRKPLSKRVCFPLVSAHSHGLSERVETTNRWFLGTFKISAPCDPVSANECWLAQPMIFLMNGKITAFWSK